MRATHTVATLEVSPETWTEISQKLLAADYTHAFVDDMVVMSGIALVCEKRERPDPASLPRCDMLDGSTLRIVQSYTEAGQFCEANCIKVADAEGREAIYVPYVDPRK